MQELPASAVLPGLLDSLLGTNTARTADLADQSRLQASSAELIVLFAGPEVGF